MPFLCRAAHQHGLIPGWRGRGGKQCIQSGTNGSAGKQYIVNQHYLFSLDDKGNLVFAGFGDFPAPEVIPLGAGPARRRLASILVLDREEDSAHPAPPTFVDLNGPDALTCVLRHAKVFDPDRAGIDLIAAYASLLDRVPVTVLRFRHDTAEIPQLVRMVRALPERHA